MASGEGRLYPMVGGEPRAIPGLLPRESFVWSADPQFLYVNQWKQGSVKVFRLNITTGQRQLFTEVTPLDEAGLCELDNILMSADGRTYVYGYSRLLSDLYLVKGVE